MARAGMGLGSWATRFRLQDSECALGLCDNEGFTGIGNKLADAYHCNAWVLTDASMDWYSTLWDTLRTLHHSCTLQNHGISTFNNVKVRAEIALAFWRME